MQIRPINKSDNVALAVVLRKVLTEIGANGDGFAFADPQLDHMFEYYAKQRGQYFVLLDDNQEIVGGAGIGELKGEQDTIELQKMYFLPSARGQGYAQKMLSMLLDEAKLMGYKKCYLETLDSLTAAIKVYEKNGFKHLSGPCGETGHFGCNIYMLKKLL